MPAKGSSAGGGYSTVADMYSFALTLLGNKYLNESNKEILFTTPETLPNSYYGHGFEIHKDTNSKLKRVGHSGRFSGVSTNIDAYLDQDYIAVVLSNYSLASGPAISKIRELLAQAKD